MNDLKLLVAGVRNENRIFWRTAVAAFFTLGLPLIMLVIFVALFGNEEHATEYGVISTAQFYAPGLAVFAAASATYTNIGLLLTVRRDDGILKRVRGTPIPPRIYLAGVVLSAVWIAFVATVVMVGIGGGVYGINIELAKVPAMAISFLAGAICFATLGIALAAVAQSSSSAPAIANATLLPLGFISNVFVSFGQDGPRWLEILGDIFPLKHFAVAFSESMSPFSEAPAIEWIHIGGLVLWTVVGAVVAGRKFRWEPGPGATRSGRRSRLSP